MNSAGAKSAEEVCSGILFNLQRYSIHDGPGIRTTVFLKGCPLRCFWCQNPESQRIQPELMLDWAACTGCGTCVQVCPRQANFVQSGELTVDRSRCTGCGACVDACPTGARTITGKTVTVDEILDVVMKDRAMYEKSGGGLTLSGGDPVFQPEFSVALLKAAKRRGLHTAVETSGYAPWDILREILAYTDYLFFDIKALAEDVHRVGTGADNRIILENIKEAVRLPHLTVQVRIPLIPGYNDSEEHIAQIARFVTGDLGLPAEQMSLLKYNKYMESKYKRLDRENQLRRLEPQSAEYLDRLKKVIQTCAAAAKTSKEDAEWTQ